MPVNLPSVLIVLTDNGYTHLYVAERLILSAFDPTPYEIMSALADAGYFEMPLLQADIIVYKRDMVAA